METESDEWVWRVEAAEEEREPCCMVTEGAWTWFGCILLTLFLAAAFNLKYYRKVVGKPHNLHKEENEKVLKEYLVAQQKGIGCQLPPSPISVQAFKQAYQERKKHPGIYKLEFSMGAPINDDIGAATNVARRETNLAKNRNVDLLPFDRNLVRVKGVDYINASHVVGHNGANYIVTQGPLDDTVSDMWQMVWEHEVHVIAMLTKTFDFIKVMCVQYWPSLDREERYGNLVVKTVAETRFANFVERRIRLVKDGGEGREIVQLQYTEWACHGDPVEETLLHFRRRVHAHLQNRPDGGPCLVHCADGGGRSGVYILLDYNLRLLASENQLDIYNKFLSLRADRMGLVSEEKQYSLVFSLIYTYLHIQDHLRYACELNAMDWTSEDVSQKIEAEHRVVTGLVSPLGQGECAGAHREDNRNKNRNHLIVPPDAARPYITSFQGNSCTDYINAVFVDGYLKSKEFIVTEWPMNHTIPDFWSMVYDHEVSTVVVFDRAKGSSRFPVFWPTPDLSVNFGPVFNVERCKDERNSDRKSASVLTTALEKRDFTVINIDVRKQELSSQRKAQSTFVGESEVPSLSTLVAGVAAPSRQIRLFILHTWPQGLISVMERVSEWRRERNCGGPVCVVSEDGVARLGAYTLLSYAADQLKREGAVNLPQGATIIKRGRPQLLKMQSEYKLVYQLLPQFANHSK